MIDALRATSDVAAPSAICKDRQRKLVEDQIGVFLLTQHSLQAFRKCLDGFTWVPTQSFEFNFQTMKGVGRKYLTPDRLTQARRAHPGRKCWRLSNRTRCLRPNP